MFWWHIGPIICKAETEMPAPAIRMIQLPKPVSAPPVLSRQSANDAIVVTNLAKLTARNWRITHETLKALRSPQKRKVMILSERLDHLRTLEKELQTELKKDSALADVTTSFYVGEWFTGKVSQRLRPNDWPMEDGGREKAIKTVYTSISRRKGYKGFIDVRAKKKIHTVEVKLSDLKGLKSLYEDFPDDMDQDDPVELILEDCSDDELFNLAKAFKIRQKEEEIMRKLSDEELYEAERARVLYATYQMCAEGIDLPAVDVVGFVTPVSDVEQAIGRGRRHCLPSEDEQDKCEHFCPWRVSNCEGKNNLVVFDIVDVGFPLCSKRERWRKQWYWDNGFKVAEGQ